MRDLLAVYRRHRRMYFNRSQSLKRALWVCLPVFNLKAKQ